MSRYGKSFEISKSLTKDFKRNENVNWKEEREKIFSNNNSNHHYALGCANLLWINQV